MTADEVVSALNYCWHYVAAATAAVGEVREYVSIQIDCQLGRIHAVALQVAIAANNDVVFGPAVVAAAVDRLLTAAAVFAAADAAAAAVEYNAVDAVSARC